MIKSKYYEGREVSKYGVENGRVDLETLGDVMGGVLNNSIIERTEAMGLIWTPVNGSLYIYYDNDGNSYTENEAQDRINELEDMIFEADEDLQEDEIEAWNSDIESLSEPGDERTIFQYFIVSDRAAETLMRDSQDAILFYNADLDMYVWGVTTYGTAWKMVLTDIPLVEYED